MHPSDAFSLLDAQIHLGALSDQDLRDLRYFGVGGAVAVCGDDLPAGEGKDILAYLSRLLVEGSARLRAAGIAPFFAVGVPPGRIPDRGFEEVLSEIPALAELARVVAIGAIGLREGGEEEEEVFQRQLELASSLALPLVVATPAREKERLTRRTLALLKEHRVPAERVLVSGVTPRTLPLVRSRGHLATLLIHPSGIRAEEAVRLIGKHGSQGLVLASDLGSGPGDLVAMPRAVHLLARAGLSRVVARKVARENALAFFQIDPDALRT